MQTLPEMQLQTPQNLSMLGPYLPTERVIPAEIRKLDRVLRKIGEDNLETIATDACHATASAMQAARRSSSQAKMSYAISMARNTITLFLALAALTGDSKWDAIAMEWKQIERTAQKAEASRLQKENITEDEVLERSIEEVGLLISPGARI